MTMLSHTLRTSVLAGSVCAVILGGLGAAATAKGNAAPGEVTAKEALKGAINGSEAGLRALQFYLSGAARNRL